MSLRRLPFQRALHRPNLLLGGERGPVLAAACFGAGLAMAGQNKVTLIVGALLWFCALPVLRWMAKADPQMTEVYRRHIRYRGYYPPRSRPYRSS